jgi:putative ABC transport system permease protein
MFKNWLITTFRNLIRDKYYSAINILGLAVGLTIAIFIILYVFDEITYDQVHLLHERIYRLESDFTINNKNDKFAITQVPLGPTLKDEYPEIAEFARCINIGTQYYRYGDKEFTEDSIFFADSTFFKIFTHRFLYGDPEHALNRPNTMVVTKSFADRYFGSDNPLGQTIRTITGEVFEISGVIENLPDNLHLKFNGLMSAATIAERVGVDRFNDRSSSSFWNVNVYTYILLAEGSNIQSVIDKSPQFYDKYMKEVGDQIHASFNLMATPLDEIHLKNPKNPDLGYDLPTGNKSYIYIFSFAALLILIIASINYMNMSTARSMRRSKEVGLRKVTGANRSLLVWQFLGESILITVFSYILSVLLVYLMLPVFNDLTGKGLHFNFSKTPELIGISFIIAILVGLLSGTYPAFFLSSFNPVAVLKGITETLGGKGIFRKVLVVLQFTISVFMIIGTLTISKQLRYMRTTDLGFDKDNLMVMVVRDSTLRKSMDSFREELMKNPDIKGTALSTSDPGQQMGIQVMRMEGDSGELNDKAFNNYFVDYDYIDLLGINMKLGRNYSRDMGTDVTKGFIINETAARDLGWGDDALGKRFQFGINLDGTAARDGEVIGVVSDYHYKSLHNKIDPLVLLLPDNLSFLPFLNIKTTGKNTDEVIKYINQKREEFGDLYPFDYKFITENLDEYYKSEIMIGKIFKYFTIITIFIAALGLLGLSAFMAQQKTHEIGIRKVVGSSEMKVVYRFVREFSIWVIIANVIAWPIAYFAIKRWLQYFQYRIDITIWIFLFALLLSWAIAILTTAWQSIRAASANPAESLKYE